MILTDNVDLMFNTLTKEVVDWAISKGWEPNELTFGDKVALLHSEVSEALEAYRVYGLKDATRTFEEIATHHSDGRMHGLCVHGEQRGECKMFTTKPEGVGSEFADILIRLLHSSANCGIDLAYEYKRKMAYNHSRGHRHGGKTL